MRFEILGALRVHDGERTVQVTGARQRVLLAALLAHACQVIPARVLAELVWDGSPPDGAVNTLRSHVMRLRRALGPQAASRVVTRSPGYLITADPGEVDLLQFGALCQECGSAVTAGEWERAGALAAEALGLWRGEPLADIPSRALTQEEVPRLQRLRVQALEWHTEAGLQLGRHAELVPLLQELTAGHRLHERFHAQLMLVLYRCGRQADALAAYHAARAVLAEELGVDPSPEVQEMYQRILTADSRLAWSPAQARPPGGGAAPLGGTQGAHSPYRGLKAFEERDAPFFFGRETVTTQVLEQMARCLDGAGLLVVSGVSGAGKSSLLRAGLLPALRQAGLPSVSGAARWPCLMFTPSHRPLDELATRIAPLAAADAAMVRTTLETDPAAFALTARQAVLNHHDGPAAADDSAGTRPRLVIIVDQFEQLFTLCPDERQRQAFITALHAAATTGHGPEQAPAVLAILGIRADFEARCADYPKLADLVQDRYLVTAMNPRQLRMAITGPARTAGSRAEAELVEVLLQEMSTHQPTSRMHTAGSRAAYGAGALPLLSHALDQAWRNRRGDTLTLADYERAGGIERAVGISAQRAYNKLTPDQQTAAREVFLRMTTTNSDGIDTGQRVSTTELTEGKSPAQARDVCTILEVFTAERLLTLGGGTVEISHEVLLTAWPLLDGAWLAETRTDRLTRTRLLDTATEWARSACDPSYLYHGTLLESAARITSNPARHPPLNPAERQFLNASSRAHRRHTQRRRTVLALLTALVTALGALALWGNNARREAIGQRNAAIAARFVIESESPSTSPALAKLESLAAWRISPSPQTRYAMLNAAALPGITALPTHDGPVHALTFSPNGKTLAAAYANHTAILWNTATGNPVGHPLPTSEDYASLAFSPDSRLLAVGLENSLRLWTVATQQQIGRQLTCGYPDSFSPDGGTIAANCLRTNRSFIQMFDTDTHRRTGTSLPIGQYPAIWTAFIPGGKIISATGGDSLVELTRRHRPRPLITVAGSAKTCPICDVALSPDGSTLATINGSGQVSLWNLRTRHRVGGTFGGTGDGESGISFNPSGKILATTDGGGKVRLWNTATHQQIPTPITGSAGDVSSLAFSPGSDTLATGSNDGTIRLWNVTAAMNSPASAPFINGTGGTAAMAFTGSGELLASATGDGTLRRWNLTSHHQINMFHPGRVAPVMPAVMALSSEGKTLATLDKSGKTVLLWDTATGRQTGRPLPIPSHAGVQSVAFSPDSRILATSDGTGVQLWDVPTHQRVLVLHTGLTESGIALTTAAFSPDGKTLAVNTRAGGTQLWNLTAHQAAETHLPDAVSRVTSMAFSPGGQILATGSDTGAQLWDIATRQQIGATLTASNESRQGSEVAFSPGGQILATSDDTGVRLWDVTTRQQIGTTLTTAGNNARSGQVLSIAFSSDGTILAGSGLSSSPQHSIVNTVWWWDLPDLIHAMTYLCATAEQFIKPAQWARYEPETAYSSICPHSSP